MAGGASAYFRVAVLSSNSNFYLSPTPNGSLQIVGGYEAQFLDMLSKGLRLQPVVSVSEEDEWGRQNDDGDWTGLIGMVQRGEVDMAVSSLLITETRLKVVDYSYPYSIEDVTFATRNPGTVPTATALIKPFSLDLWIGLVASLAAFSLAFCFLMSKKNSFHKIVFVLLGYVLNQPSNMPTRKLTDRILIGAWMCGTVFLSKTYSSFLLSFLTLPIKQDGVKDVEQLELSKAVSNGAYRCYTTRGSSLLEGLSISGRQDTRVIAESVVKNDWLLDSEARLFEEHVRMENTAIIRTRQFIKNIFQDEEVFVSDDSFYSAYAAIVLPKNSTLKLKINRLIHRITQSAVYGKSIDHYLFHRTLIKNSQKTLENNNIKKISLEDLEGAILFLIAGYFVATVVCLLEILCNLTRKKYNVSIGSNDRAGHESP